MCGLQDRELFERKERCSRDYVMFRQDVLIPGKVSPDNLILTGNHSWVPTEEMHLLLWKVVQLLVDHLCINGYIEITSLRFLVKKYAYDIIADALPSCKLPDDDTHMPMCVFPEKARAAMEEVYKMAHDESQPGRSHPSEGWSVFRFVCH